MICIFEKLKTTPISFVTAKDILSSHDELTLGHEQSITLEYLRKFVKLESKDVEFAIKELTENVSILKDYHIIMIIDNLPFDEDELKLLFMKERINLEKDQIKTILEIVDKIRPENVSKN
ncbi:MAG: hypothetical protein K0B02_03345 [DPANN group archaeon]|nr:hypothetical protein [DPANN group archaeon]